LIPTAVHTLEDVDRTIAAFEEINAKLLDGTYAAQASPLDDVELVTNNY
jgi:hypothetical protein